MKLKIATLAAALAAFGVGISWFVSTDSPLGADSGGGTMGVYPPKASGTWEAMFGSMILCVDTPDVVTITKVAPTTTSDGQPVRAVVRRVAREAARAGETPIGSSKGDPAAQFDREPGQSVEPAIGAKVYRPCSNDPWKEGFDELLVVPSTTGAGNYVKDVRVTYEFRGREHEVNFGGTYSLCDRRKVCPGLG